MSDSDKSGSSFWSALDNFLRARPTSTQADKEPKQDKKAEATLKTVQDFDQDAPSDEIFKRLNSLKSSEPFENRLKSFEELIKLSELFQLNESSINNFLKVTSDLYKIDRTPAEIRIKAFNYLIQFYQKKSDKFDSFMLRNHLLCFIIINCKKSKCIFLNALNQISKPTSPEDGHNSILENLRASSSTKLVSDDLKLRLTLFLLVTRNGNNCKNLDPDLMSECLVYFLENSELLIDKFGDLFIMFKNLMTNKYFQYTNEQILTMLSRTILNFSYLVTANFERPGRLNQEDIKSCVDLIENLIENITSSICINYVVLCLCELLDIVWQNGQPRTEVQLSRNEALDFSDLLISQIYGCMSKLFVSPIGSYAVFTFFSEIFPISTKYQVHRKHQINGALMHIKKIFDEFKQSKSKNIYLIKELHINCLIYLPNALKSCCTDGPREQQLIIFKHIVNLTIDLVHLASHRDLFMCLLTYNSRKFLIEIVNQFSVQNLDDDVLVKKYADLINLLDLKDVFSYKTSQKESSSGQTLFRNPSSASLNSDNLEELSFIMYKFKEAFYDLVYKFPHPNYLKDNCINNCVDFYLQRKFLPIFGSQSIEGIKTLLEKYLAVRNKFSIVVRKNLIEALHRKINEYFQMDHKSFIEQLVSQVLIAAYEITLVEEDSHFRSVPSAQKMDFIFDLFEMKYFVVTKLIELVNVSNDENNVLKIIKIFEKIIEMEKVSSVEMLVPHGLVFATVPNNSQMTGSFNNQLLLKHPNGNFSNCLSYLYKIVTHGLIEIFEKYFHKDNKTFTACSLEIFNILVKYIEYYYLTQYNFNSANSFMSNNPSSLSSIAAENLPVQNQIEAQSNSKFFNYYSHIRKEIFDFLLRIRSNPEGRVLLIDRVNRRKFIQSKYLMLNLCETKARFSEDFEQKNLLKCELDFGKILKMIEYCLDKEVDWHVITRLLAELPYVMQYEMDLIKMSDFTYKLFTLLYKKDINVIRNKPENLSGQEYISKFYPLLASMVLYHSSFEKNSQENILQNLASGIHASRNLFCLEILTIAMTEMHETNANQCAELLLKLSQFSSSLAIAQPILELLSTISDFKKLHSVCATKEFIAVSATAIKYIDPFKFNPFIVLMAHYVLCAWFIKCKPESRKSYASFTSRGLYQEVIVQLDNKVNYREKKSPNKLPEQENLTNAQKRLSAVEPNQKNEPKSAQPENHGSSRAISDNLKQFYRDLVEITMDFMSNNMNYDSSYLNQSSSIHNSGEFMADRFSSIGSLPGNYNQSGLFENKENKKNGQKSKLWLIGNKIIQVTTGLFSNVCTEQEPLMSASRNKNSKSLSKCKSVHSQAIDIPSDCGQNTESMASSNSSTSVSVTNSLSSNSKGDSTLAQVGDKSDQDIFDETIDANESAYTKTELVKPCGTKLAPCGPKKNRLIKRRYKSGLPLTADADSMEESILKSLNDNGNKLSKDDSVLNPDTGHFLPFCCIKNGHDINHHHHHETNKGSELCNPNCWCNNLVEIKCRYPTKVVSFVSLVEPNFSNFHSVNLANFDKILKSHPFELSPEKLMKQNAIELRRLNILARISESSASNDTPPNEKLDTEKKPNTSRKPSLDTQPDPDTNIFMSTRSAPFNQCLDPSQVFLHLFQNQHFATETDQPTLIPDNDAIKRSLNILDYYSCFWLHKIGVVYVGANQAYDEKAILSNCSGSVRYRTFVNSLGNLICLRDMDTDQFYPGGLDTDGTVGDFAVIWFDGTVQVLFHIATLMLTEENTNSKKRHIGNDSTIIVYNESGEEYNFSMIKGEVNCVCIEIIPLKSNTNIVKVKTTSEMSQWLTYSDPKFVSDQNLGLIVRKMALHADIASKVFRSQKDGVVFYGGRFYDRLKQIKRIMKQAKESQKSQQPAKTGNESKSGFTLNSEKVVGQMDFLEYI